jgi:radical SAM-linked protein
MWERAAARAELPLRFTQGFNPHPKLSFGLPRPVGVASHCNLVVLEFSQDVADASWAVRLGKHFPDGMRLLRAEPLPVRARIRPVEAKYEMPLEEAERPALKARLSELARKEKWEVRRAGAGRKDDRLIDIRNRLSRLRVEPDRLSFVVSAIQGSSARPADVLKLLGFGEGSTSDGPGSAELCEAMARLVQTNLECEISARGPEGRIKAT